MLSEDAMVAAIARVAGAAAGEVELAIGDDAAVIAGGLVASTDILVEGVHFASARMSVRDIGHRAAAVNLSALAAMGAEPVCLLAAFGLPRGFTAVDELTAGLLEHGVPVAGGDLSRSPVMVVSVTALGRAERPVLRSGGRPGDGIAADAARLAHASGTGAVIELERLPCAPGAGVEQAAGGGEDYELLAALPPDRPAPVPVTEIGLLTEDPEVAFVDAAGDRRSLRGWDHFA